MSQEAATLSASSADVVVIGGGISGLYTALRLIEAGVTGIKVFEGRGTVGGRVSTTRDAEGKPILDNCAWRVGETNVRMLALAKELGIELREQYTPPGSHKGSHKGCAT